MKYAIMKVKSQRDNYETLYQFMTKDIDGIATPIILNSDEELNEYLSDLLNNKGYGKEDFLVVQMKYYKIKPDLSDENIETDNSELI